ncbi:OmpH family outer membrane protein [uncultured Veillonella sp.]|uniref:OmpH family outer membrane protein n=1 Tax=uncultured Veillonella sp. TaxID=159268 RepID=UPI00262C83D3|nr:OmpH family outer membrane protein [uncultured Veillonella sp.]
MKLTYRWILLALVVAVALVAGYLVMTHLKSPAQDVSSNAPKIGYVNMENIIKLNPSYQQYMALKAEYEALEGQYTEEQKTLTLKAAEQQKALQALGGDQEITNQLNIELVSKIKAKEQELNVALQKQRIALINKYRGEVQTNPTEADLCIVNLQLELSGNTAPIAYTEEQKASIAADRAAKEEELKALLAQRGENVAGSLDTLEQKVDRELAPMRAAGQQELEAYAAGLQKELLARRDDMMKSKAESIMASSNLPTPADWNSAWNSKLSAKKSELDALHDAILEDVRMRAAVVAQEKGLYLIVVNKMASTDAIDVTDAIIASYGSK